ncbi:hypothetical protein MUK70_29985 [Dyadobacter chenwenxiniae]|uniref:Uncharacterized protein n=1 Tax=Dyadobacter chenwenxiniae TaxID=2906456 RepID=A0A9X1TG12_9BACT|nr:hypothetical protein [Dyadobacter chenwenxiniae]MCF0063552.1 hypothetical protein [Dyadobacter chenwenxiniae]UON83230.1 hypothetical protein MUK70_29985 [Dyadobacter chenwenxiniae]
MKRAAIILILSMICHFSTKGSDQIREFIIVESDTLTYTLKLVLDDSGQPQYFFRNIFTPVCYTNECKPVHINFYWDLLGNYERFDLPEGKVLTKVDHDEFKQEDYEKLQEILAQPNSIFADLQMEDLITKGTDNLTDSVDAKAGATLKTIKNQVIDGAVYTCYTLWHIAYGTVVPEMKKIIENYKNDILLHRFLASNNYQYQYWAIEKVMDKKGNVQKAYEADLENIIEGRNIFIAKNALQRVSSDFLSSQKRQEWLWKTYQKSPYALQIAILKKLKSVHVTTTLASNLKSSLEKSNEEQTSLIQQILNP